MLSWLIPLLLLVAFEAVADIFAKEWSLSGKFKLAFWSLLFYLICNSFWLLAMRNGAQLARGAVLFSVMSAILALFIGIGCYKEPLTSIIGMCIGLVAIILLSVGGK